MRARSRDIKPSVSGAVDWITWGAPFHSTIEYVRYNLIESGASDHGVSPWDFYLEQWLWQRMGWGLVACLLLALFRPGGGALLLIAAATPVAALSAIAHKEERFLLSSYPLILAAGAPAAFSYLVLERGSPEAEWAIDHGFEEVAAFDEAIVFRRVPRTRL